MTTLLRFGLYLLLVCSLGSIGFAQDVVTETPVEMGDPPPLENPDVIFYNTVGDGPDVGGPVGPPQWVYRGEEDEGIPYNDLAWMFGGDTIINPELIDAYFGGVGGLTPFAQTGNQRAVAQILDNLPTFAVDIHPHTPPGDVFGVAIMSNALLLPRPKAAALNALTGEVYGSMQSVGLQIGDRALRSVSQRLINTAAVLSNDGFTAMRPTDPFAPAENGIRGQNPMARVGGWVQGYGVDGTIHSNGNAGAAGYSLGGLSYGVDLYGDENVLVGITAGHSWSNFGTGDNARGDITSHQVGLYNYLKWTDTIYTLGVMQYGHHRYDITRTVPIGPLALVAKSSPKGNGFNLYTESGLNLDGETVRWQPFFGVQYQFLANRRAFDQGGGGINLNVDRENANTAYTHLGTRLIFNGWTHRNGATLTPYLNARWMAELIGESRTANVALAGLPGAGWTVVGTRPGRHVGVFGPGVSLQLSERLSLYGTYDLQVAQRFLAHTGNGGLLFEF